MLGGALPTGEFTVAIAATKYWVLLGKHNTRLQTDNRQATCVVFELRLPCSCLVVRFVWQVCFAFSDCGGYSLIPSFVSLGREKTTMVSVESTWMSDLTWNSNNELGELQYLVGGLVAIFYFPIYWECHHPNWRSYFSEGFNPNHQPGMCWMNINWCIDITSPVERFSQGSISILL